MSRRVLAVSAGIVGGAASASMRIPVPDGQGCNVIGDRAACCLFVDGRYDEYFNGQYCVPAREGASFDAGQHGEGPVCQPACWVRGTCSEENQEESSATCPAPLTMPESGGRITVPMGLGCSAVTDRESCCHFVDGRTAGPYAGEACVPSRRNTYFEVGDEAARTVCEPSCWAAGTCGDGKDQAARTGFCSAPEVAPLPAAALVEQAGARVPLGGRLRFYVIGSSNAAWQTWPDQMHAMLRRMGYEVTLPSTDVPGEATGPVGRRTPKCVDAASYETLSTPRLGLQGWSTWGFAYESDEDCDAHGFRSIAGWNVSCTNGWACTERWRGPVEYVPVSSIAKGVKDADVVILANFVNDGRNAQYCPHACYGAGKVPNLTQTIDITAEDLKRTMRRIREENPNVVVLVLAKYADAKQVLYVNDRTLKSTQKLNAAVRERVETEPNTHFVDVDFPLDVNMFQTLNTGHANCRGDKVLASSVINAMYEHKVIAGGLAFDDAECLGRADCGSLSLGCCQRSALCYVDSNSTCSAYGPGLQ
mmetsp:Transcript_130223/g.376755  ORF Transcript_130223/g.376755 Transcript_130223/m.376755 type:complete len:534 (+) Transcript_130223:69-1670(+)